MHVILINSVDFIGILEYIKFKIQEILNFMIFNSKLMWFDISKISESYILFG